MFKNLIVVALAIVTINSCHDSDLAESEAKIVGGELASPKEYFASIVNENQPKIMGCGASFISENVLITAAHCLEGAKDKIRIGFYNDDPEKYQVLSVDTAISHPDYEEPKKGFDIALLKIKNDQLINLQIPITPIPLIRNLERASPGKMATVVGRGFLESNLTGFEDKLREATMPIVSLEQCSSEWGNLQDSNLCAGFPEGGVSPCRGDSGSPLVVEGDSGPVLAGLVSYGSGVCGEPGVPSVYTRVSSYLPWIDEMLAFMSQPTNDLNQTLLSGIEQDHCVPNFSGGIQKRARDGQYWIQGSYRYAAMEKYQQVAMLSDDIIDQKRFSCKPNTDIVNGELSYRLLTDTNSGKDFLVADLNNQFWLTPAKKHFFDFFFNCKAEELKLENVMDRVGLTFQGNRYLSTGLSEEGMDSSKLVQSCDFHRHRAELYWGSHSNYEGYYLKLYGEMFSDHKDKVVLF